MTTWVAKSANFDKIKQTKQISVTHAVFQLWAADDAAFRLWQTFNSMNMKLASVYLHCKYVHSKVFDEERQTSLTEWQKLSQPERMWIKTHCACGSSMFMTRTSEQEVDLARLTPPQDACIQRLLFMYTVGRDCRSDTWGWTECLSDRLLTSRLFLTWEQRSTHCAYHTVTCNLRV